MAHPWVQHVISLAALEDGVAAGKREVEKSKKYAGEWDVWGHPSNCIALVFEHFGRWGDDALQFLHRLSLQSLNEDGRKNSSEFKTFWRRCLSVALQRQYHDQEIGKTSEVKRPYSGQLLAPAIC